MPMEHSWTHLHFNLIHRKVHVNYPDDIWDEEDEKFDISVTKFGNDTLKSWKSIQIPLSTSPITCQNIGKTPLMQKNDAVAHEIFFENYKYLWFFDSNDWGKKLIVISSENLFLNSVKRNNCGWSVTTMLESYNRTNIDTHIDNWKIRNDLLQWIWDDCSHQLPNIKFI